MTKFTAVDMNLFRSVLTAGGEADPDGMLYDIAEEVSERFVVFRIPEKEYREIIETNEELIDIFSKRMDFEIWQIHFMPGDMTVFPVAEAHAKPTELIHGRYERIGDSANIEIFWGTEEKGE